MIWEYNREKHICKGENTMNILVIGNGFDLAHGLPAKYTDFLEFAMVMQQMVDSEIPNNKIDYGKLLPELVEMIKEKMNSVNREEWKELIYDNLWIKYFLWNPLYQKENWIDFENEIGKVIQQLDGDMFYEEGQKYQLTDNMVNLSNDFLGQIYSKYTVVSQSVDSFLDNESRTITFKEIRDRLYQDMNKLIRALELYLTEFIGNMKIRLESPDIKEIAKKIVEHENGNKGVIISNVLCFNYTNTYERIYFNGSAVENHIDYIHGKANISATMETNNMVLGIDEYLPDDRKNRDIEFIAFKKYFQRIHKETGCKYKEWVDDIQEDESKFKGDNKLILNKLTSGRSNGKYESYKKYVHNLYIFGHSLDITDGDILRDLILNDNVHTTIYYLNKGVMGHQIANLVKVIGQDELIKRTGGSTKTIEFKLQQDMVERV